MPDSPVIYQRPIPGTALRQGEILSRVAEYCLDVDTLLASGQTAITFTVHPYAMVVSQECDLGQDFKSRTEGRPSVLSGILLCEADEAVKVKARESLKSVLYKPVRQNKSERFQYLSSIPAAIDLSGEGIGELLVDFRRCFAVRADEIYAQMDSTTAARFPNEVPAMRRAQLVELYAQEVNTRFAYYTARVPIPLQHHLAQREFTEEASQ